jgi:metallo-beta-lactamase family protein
VHSGPKEGEIADLLVMESTYGNRIHPIPTRCQSSRASFVKQCSAGQVVVPASPWSARKNSFSLLALIESGQIPRVPVFCDSPMAINAVKIFLKYSSEYQIRHALIEKFARRSSGPDSRLRLRRQNPKINDIRYPVIIISSSGMVTEEGSCIISRYV